MICIIMQMRWNFFQENIFSKLSFFSRSQQWFSFVNPSSGCKVMIPLWTRGTFLQFAPHFSFQITFIIWSPLINIYPFTFFQLHSVLCFTLDIIYIRRQAYSQLSSQVVVPVHVLFSSHLKSLVILSSGSLCPVSQL